MTETNPSKHSANGALAEPAEGTLAGLLDWNELDQVWQKLTRGSDANWYWYEPDQPLSDTPVTASKLCASIETLNQYLRKSHQQDYCGIVYVDSVDDPTLIRVFDPATLLSMCNINGYVTPPGWVITKMDPTEIASWKDAFAVGQNSDRGNHPPTAPRSPGATQTLDARRMGCPLPLVHTSRALKRLAIDDILEVVTREPGSINDIEAICRWTGQIHVALAEGDYGYSFFVQRKPFKNTRKSLTRD